VEEIFKSESLDIYALMVKGSGIVYAGTSPEGKIYKITGEGSERKSVEFFDPDEKFIWDLKADKNGDIICAVGNSGGVYRITPSGQAAKIFTPEDTHIGTLYITRSNSILAGSGDRGILYRIDNRKVKVLFDSPFEEIRGICEDKSGNIYFTATRGLLRDDRSKQTERKSLKKKKETRVQEPPEKSVLYCLHTSGIVEKLWTSKTEYIYTAHYDEANDGVVIGTGDTGRVYRVKRDGSFSILYESDSAQIFKIVGGQNGFNLITNNTATLATVENTLNSKGIYYSEVYDLEIQSKLGRLYWDAQVTGQTNIQLFVRTGNSNVPDKTWSAWSAPYTDSENSAVNISNCRYFQVKVVLNSKNAIETPYLSRYKVFYVQSNLSPMVKKIDIYKPVVAPVTQSSASKKDGAKKKTGTPNYLAVTWNVKDQNNDKLKYDIYIKKEAAKNWILVEENLTRKRYELDTELFQDGKYLLKVVADDSLANPPAMARSSQLISQPFLIDSTAPVVGNFSASGNQVAFTVTDKTSIVSKVFYSLDGKLWFPVFPKDMINDSKSETYSVQIKNLQSRKFIFLKAMDEFSNVNVFQEEF